MVAKVAKMTEEQITAHCARLRQYAAVLADFHEALIVERLPADTAKDLVVAWWESELTWEGQ